MNFLNDDWAVNGSSIETFREELKNFNSNTKITKRNMDDFQFLNIHDTGTELAAFPLSGKDLWKKTNAAFSLKKFPVEKPELMELYDKDIFNEALKNGLFVIYQNRTPSLPKAKRCLHEREYIPVSERAISTISNRVKLGGYNFSKPGLVRDLSIATYFSKPIPAYTIERNDPVSGTKKVFAVMSDKYSAISQETVLSIIDAISQEAVDELGESVCNFWTIDHSTTRIYINFPECADAFKEDYKLPDEIVPGVMVETSDTGDSSLRIRGYFLLGNSISYTESEFMKIHSGELNMGEMLNIIKNHIFPEYLAYPEKLARLLTIDLFDESMSNAGRIKKITSLYRDISKEIGLVKAIGKKREKALMDQMIESINPALNYTAYDIVETFLTLPSAIAVGNKAVIDAISKISRKVLDFDFKEEELLLV